MSCGARLEPDATACQVCGTEVSHDEFLAEPRLQVQGELRNTSGLSTFQKGLAIALIAVCIISGASFGISRWALPDVRKSPPPDHGQEQHMSEEAFKKEQQEMMAQSHALLQNVKDSLKNDPDNPQLILKIANLYYDIKNFKEAEPYYSKYLTRFDPENTNARVDYGYVLFKSDKQQQGIAQLQQVLKTEPDHAFALFNLGIMYYELNNIQEAKVWFEKCASMAKEERLKTMATQILQDLNNKKTL